MTDTFSHYLSNYKNQFVAEGTTHTEKNKSLLEKAQNQINAALTELTIERNKLQKENRHLRKRIDETNNTIKRTKKKHQELEGESTRLINGDLGAIEQNNNIKHVFKGKRIKLFFKVCLIALILFFLYINDDVVQAIRGKVSKKPQ